MDIYKSLLAAFRAYFEVKKSDPNTILSSLQVFQIELAKGGGDNSPARMRGATNEVLLQGLMLLGEQDKSAEKLLRWRFLDKESTKSIAKRVNASTHIVNRMQKAAIEEMGQLLLAKEAELVATQTAKNLSNMPSPTYTKLFGIETAVKDLMPRLLNKDAPWIIAVTGIGGSGKTALAHYLTKEAIEAQAFNDVIWVKIKSQGLGVGVNSSQVLEIIMAEIGDKLGVSHGLPSKKRFAQVRDILTQAPYLIIIDNVEEPNVAANIFLECAGFSNPTKFLITSRARPLDATTAFTYHLSQLNKEDAFALLRYEAEQNGISALQTATKEALSAIFSGTGGNPLALKIVARLTQVLPLNVILAELRLAKNEKAADMYKRIYWQAWRSLSASARSLLKSMPLAGPDGTVAEHLAIISGVGDNLWLAISELISRSLLEKQGSIIEPLYAIHPLTESFLHTDILNWPTAPTDQENEDGSEDVDGS